MSFSPPLKGMQGYPLDIIMGIGSISSDATEITPAYLIAQLLENHDIDPIMARILARKLGVTWEEVVECEIKIESRKLILAEIEEEVTEEQAQPENVVEFSKQKLEIEVLEAAADGAVSESEEAVSKPKKTVMLDPNSHSIGSSIASGLASLANAIVNSDYVINLENAQPDTPVQAEAGSLGQGQQQQLDIRQVVAQEMPGQLYFNNPKEFNDAVQIAANAVSAASATTQKNDAHETTLASATATVEQVATETVKNTIHQDTLVEVGSYKAVPFGSEPGHADLAKLASLVNFKDFPNFAVGGLGKDNLEHGNNMPNVNFSKGQTSQVDTPDVIVIG